MLPGMPWIYKSTTEGKVRNMFDLKIMQHISTISENTRNGRSLQFNVVSVNGGPDQYDISRWQKDSNGKAVRKGGLILSGPELDKLINTLKEF